MLMVLAVLLAACSACTSGDLPFAGLTAKLMLQFLSLAALC
jgi:hypothetical protein